MNLQFHRTTDGFPVFSILLDKAVHIPLLHLDEWRKVLGYKTELTQVDIALVNSLYTVWTAEQRFPLLAELPPTYIAVSRSSNSYIGTKSMGFVYEDVLSSLNKMEFRGYVEVIRGVQGEYCTLYRPSEKLIAKFRIFMCVTGLSVTDDHILYDDYTPAKSATEEKATLVQTKKKTGTYKNVTTRFSADHEVTKSRNVLYNLNKSLYSAEIRVDIDSKMNEELSEAISFKDDHYLALRHVECFWRLHFLRSIVRSDGTIRPSALKFVRKYVEGTGKNGAPNPFVDGGRLYATVQNLPSVVREEMTINGEKTVELDYVACQPRIAYNVLLKRRCRKDPYAVPGVDRKIVKSFVTAALCAPKLKGSIYQWYAGICLNDPNLQYSREHVDLIMKYIGPISKLFFTGAWGKLQKIDSDIALEIVRRFCRRTGSPIIPIHDSFLVQKRYEETLYRIMMDVWKRYTGFSPVIKGMTRLARSYDRGVYYRWMAGRSDLFAFRHGCKLEPIHTISAYGHPIRCDPVSDPVSGTGSFFCSVWLVNYTLTFKHSLVLRHEDKQNLQRFHSAATRTQRTEMWGC